MKQSQIVRELARFLGEDCQHDFEMRISEFLLDNGYRFTKQTGESVYPNWYIEARNLCFQDRRIAAIKLIRENTGWGLKESKDYVDRHFPQN
jgi:hypothetical protein